MSKGTIHNMFSYNYIAWCFMSETSLQSFLQRFFNSFFYASNIIGELLDLISSLVMFCCQLM